MAGGKVVSDGTYNYFWGAELVTNGSVYYLYNAHGDVVQLINSNGVVTKTYDYDAYGNELTRDLNDPNPFRYCGEYYDIETGFIYLRARYYSPSTGRFISVDPAKDGLNWYAYCNNNPLLYTDPLGLRIERDRNPGATAVCLDGGGGTAAANAATTSSRIPTTPAAPPKKVNFSNRLHNGIGTIRDFLYSPGEIHQAVEERALDNAILAGKEMYSEVTIMSNGSLIGRADLIQTVGQSSALIWEIKPNNPRGIKAGIKQLDRYLQGDYLMGGVKESRKLELGYDIPGETFFYSGRFYNFEVTYRSIGNGIITYDYTVLERKTAKQKVEIPDENIARGIILTMAIITAICVVGAAGDMPNRTPMKVALSY